MTNIPIEYKNASMKNCAYLLLLVDPEGRKWRGVEAKKARRKKGEIWH